MMMVWLMLGRLNVRNIEGNDSLSPGGERRAAV